MPTLNINGKRVTVDDSFLSLSPEQQDATVEEIAQSLAGEVGQSFRGGASAVTQSFQADPAAAIAEEKAKRKVRSSPLYGGGFNALTTGSQSGLMFGWDDEIGAGMMAPFQAGVDWLQGEGFDIGKAYDTQYEQGNALKEAYREDNPVTYAAGEVAGSLAGGGKAAQSGLTLTGRSIPVVGKTGAAAVEGAAYGGLYGAGDAKPGERLAGAKRGAITGAATGAVVERVGRGLANRAAKKVAPPAPALDELQQQTDALYRAARTAGAGVKASAVNRMAQNIEVAAGRLNPALRPNTAGIVDDAKALMGKDLSLDELDEFRQQVGLAMQGASAQDTRTLMRIKSVVDGLENGLTANDVTGPAGQAFQLFKAGRALNVRKQKTALVEQLLDLADVATGKYTQSGMANTIRQKASQLYSQIVKGKVKGFSAEEVAIIRQMAKGGSTSKLVNLWAKLNPKGAVSIMANLAAATSAGAVFGPAAAAVGAPIAAGGFLAGRAADRGAVAAANTLRDAAARGYVWKPPLLPNKARPFIGGATVGANQLTSRR
jgi:hypothetical protein